MKFRLLTSALHISLLLCSAATFSQSAGTTKITGTITDSSTNKEIPYASIALMKNDSFFIGTTAGADGKFELKTKSSGKYSLVITALGFLTKKTELNINGSPLELGSIKVSHDKNTLQAVTVTQLKALVEDKGDKLVYNAEKDISNSAGTATDVLRKVPNLTVDLDGNVQMRGNSNIKVLINGKPSAMMARNLKDALRQMPANVIKAVEVITSPGAKYDAEGAAGVINIITKKGLQGFSGTANASIGNFDRGLGSSFNYKKKKITLSLSVNAYQYRNKYSSENKRTSLVDSKAASYLSQQTSADNVGTGGYGEMSIDYDPDSLSRLNFSADIWGGSFPMNRTINTTLMDAKENLIEAFRNQSRFKNPFGNGQLDLGYTKSFKKTSQEFSFLTQFSRMPDNYFYETDYYSPSNAFMSSRHSENYSRNKEYTVQSDYIHPFMIKGKKDTTNIKLEVGVKSIYRDIGSEFRLGVAKDSLSPYVPDPAQSNDFAYTQKVYSGYTSVRVDTKTKWALTLGVRLERTELNGNFKTTQTMIDSKFNNLIPSFTISKTIKKQTFKISYTQRIQRPMIWLLNPWRNANDPKNVWTGNPFLLPELSHAWELGHSITGDDGFSLNTAVYYRYANNGFEFLTVVDSSGVGFTKPSNVGRRRDIGTNINISTQPNKSWNLGGGVDARYTKLSTVTSDLKNSGTVWNFNFNSTYKLPKDYSLQANGNFMSGWIDLQSNSEGWMWYGISGKKEFWEKKASLTLTANNPFKASITRGMKRFDPTFLEESSFRSINRSVRLSFEWRFGQMSAGGKETKKIVNDDKAGR